MIKKYVLGLSFGGGAAGTSIGAAMAGTEIGATIGSVVPGLGTALGAIVGYGAGQLTDDYFGQFLRYIG